MMNRGIKTKILTFLLLISMIPLTLLGYVRYIDTKVLINEREQNKIEEFHNNIEAKMIKFFGSGEKDILFLSQLAKEEISFRGDTEHVNMHLDILTSAFYHFAQANMRYEQIRFINKEGYEVIRIDNNEGKTEIVSKEQLQYKGDRYYVQEAYGLKEGEMDVSNIDLNREKGKIEEPINPMIRFTMPIYNENALQGFVVLNVKLSYILQDIEAVKERSQYKNVMILDQDGFYIMNTDKSKEWGGFRDYHTGENFKKDYPKVSKDVLTATSLKIIETEDAIISWNPIKILKGFDKKVFVVICLDKKDYLAPLHEFTKKWMIELFVILTMMIIASIYISKHLSEPIVLLTQSVENIGKGNFDVEIDIHTRDEIECLAYEVKKMSNELKNMYQNMENIVKNRTEELEFAHERMKKMANTDSLTGLYNRYYFNQFIQEEEKRIEIQKDSITICIIDVDKFKYINDFYGHNIGDEVLKSVAEILKSAVSESDVVVRYGGDEFLIVLLHRDDESMHEFIEKLYNKVREWNQNTDILDHDLSLSMGCAKYDGEGSVLEAIKTADERMYENKNAKKR